MIATARRGRLSRVKTSTGFLFGLGFALGATACGDNSAGPDDDCGAASNCLPDAAIPDAGPPDAVPPEYPLTIDDTGLCSDPQCQVIEPDVFEFAPQFRLWTDGAEKRRWIYVPPGATIDTSDMDYWVFPEGTKLWKEFVRDDTRVEIRYLHKAGPDETDWKMISYVWNEAQDRAEPTLLHVTDALGTPHDVPSRNECRQCHERLRSRVLGFGAIQLDYDAPAGLLDLDDVIAKGWLSDEPAGVEPRFPLPGTGSEQAALGYLHVNCGTCHNPSSDVVTPDPLMLLRLEVGALEQPEDTPTYQTTIDQPAGDPRIVPGDVDASKIYRKFTSDTPALRMPPLGVEIIDPTGTTTLSDWITGIGP